MLPGKTETLPQTCLKRRMRTRSYTASVGDRDPVRKAEEYRLRREFFGAHAKHGLQDFWPYGVDKRRSGFQKEADEAVTEKHKNKPVKHACKAKTSDLVITLRDRFIFACIRRNRIIGNKQMEKIIKILSSSVSPIRPDRSFPRRPAHRKKFNLFLKSHL